MQKRSNEERIAHSFVNFICSLTAVLILISITSITCVFVNFLKQTVHYGICTS